MNRWFLPILFMAMASLLASCGSTGIPSTSTNSGDTQPATNSAYLAVADTSNARVLIFDAPFVTGESASVVLGQSDFASDEELNPESASKLQEPVGLAVDASGNLYVADDNGGRVVRFQPPFTNGMNASLELGEAGFSSPGDANGPCAGPASAMILCMPTGVTLDSEGDVWVTDPWEGRVLEFQRPIQRAMNAGVAIGQQNVTDNSSCNGGSIEWNTEAPTTNASQLCMPVASTLDAHGDLWVADSNDRVLEFVPPLSTGMAASLELGFPASVGMNSPTPSAGQSCAPATASNFCGPNDLAFDTKGNLWVSDNQNNRILEFSPPFASGMAASLVIGQPNFTSGGILAAAANTLNDPNGLTFDANGDLIVADETNSRVLIFVPPFSNNMGASVVIGQPNMTTVGAHGCGDWTVPPPEFGYPSAGTLCGPQGVLAY